MEKMDRREFLARPWWLPFAGLFGLRFCTYSAGPVGPWVGWIEWFGRCIGFVARDGRVLWMRCLR